MWLIPKVIHQHCLKQLCFICLDRENNKEMGEDLECLQFKIFITWNRQHFLGLNLLKTL